MRADILGENMKLVKVGGTETRVLCVTCHNWTSTLEA